MNSKQQTQKRILSHYKTYPELQIRDILKFLHQSSFGCEHLLADPSAAVDYIQKEAQSCRPHEGELVEPLDGDYCRVHLDYLKKGLSADAFGKLFFLSASHREDGRAVLEEKLDALMELVQEGQLPFSETETIDAVEKWRNGGFEACHHSEEFRAAYAPAYRVIRREYALFLPLFVMIDRELKRSAPASDSHTPASDSCTSAQSSEASAQSRLTLAIEGGSASGKSTLGELLQQVYGCTVLHMDDFFLRPEQRTPERFAEAGGNVDRERFLEEVLQPLAAGEEIAYRRFDCGTFTIQPPEMIRLGQLTVIEGAYSMHPDLAGYYDCSVFLDVDPELQKKRIEKRNTPQLAERFFREWIPMEHRYFDALRVKERCGLVILVNEK